VRKVITSLFAGALLLASTLAGVGFTSPVRAGAVTINPVTACNPIRGTGPGYHASVGTAQNGETVCLTVGEKLLVFLAAPTTTSLGWTPIRVAPPGVLSAAPLALKLTRNVTAENFVGTREGFVKLSSQRPACNVPRGSQVFCGAVLRWEAKVQVVAKRNAELPPVTAVGHPVPANSSG
jgi:hypothetical protein